MEAGAGDNGANLRHGTGHRRGCSTLRSIEHRRRRVMTLLPPGVKVHLALGYVDMRKGIDGLAMLVQNVLRQDPFTGHLFVFRGGTRANLIKIVFWAGLGSVCSPNGLSTVSFCGPRASRRTRHCR
jgi:transposase